jgi:hypothetical protein
VIRETIKGTEKDSSAASKDVGVSKSLACQWMGILHTIWLIQNQNGFDKSI